MPRRDSRRISDGYHFPHESKVVLVYTTKYTFVNNPYAHKKPAFAVSYHPTAIMFLKVDKKDERSIS